MRPASWLGIWLWPFFNSILFFSILSIWLARAPARLWPSNRCLRRFALHPIQPFPQHPLQHGHTARPVALSFLTIARHRPRLFTRALHIASATAAPAFARLAVAMPPRLFHVHHLAQPGTPQHSAAARRQSWFTPFPACAACQQAARLATLHVGDFALRSRSSGTGRMSRAHPYPAGFRPRSTRPRPAGLPADPHSGAGRPTRSVPEAGLRIPPAGAALTPRLVASQETPLVGMRYLGI